MIVRAGLVVLGAMVVVAVVMAGMTPVTPVAVAAASPLRMPFAAVGPHAVGTTTLSPAGDEEPTISLWYPAADGATGDPVTYDYQLQIAGPFGTTAVGEYAGLATADAPADGAGAPHPLVLLSPGYAIGPDSYAWLAEHLASHGFVVVAHDTDETLLSAMSDGLATAAIRRPLTLRAVLDRLATEAATGPFAGQWSADEVAVIGHSIGGHAAQAIGGARIDTDAFIERCDRNAPDAPGAWLCDVLEPNVDRMAELVGLDRAPSGLWPDQRDPRVAAVVSLAGDSLLFDTDGLAELDVPVLAIGGTADEDTPWELGTGMTHEAASSPRRVQAGLVGAEHMAFTARCERVRRIAALVPIGFCDDPNRDRSRDHAVVAHLTAAFLTAELADGPDVSAAAALVLGTFDLDEVTYDTVGLPR